MSRQRSICLTIAGFDPCGGAGLLADIKTFEQLKLQGMSVCTANTIQTENEFHSVNWINQDIIIDQLNTILQKYEIEFVKIGLIESVDFLNRIVEILRAHKVKTIVWDPIFSASAGFEFHSEENEFRNILSKIDIVTPNWNEFKTLFKCAYSNEFKSENTVYLKGGHREDKLGYDTIIHPKGKFNLKPKGVGKAKHGSGCMLSAALLGYLCKGYPLQKASLKAKQYTYFRLVSNNSLLATHS